MSDGDWCGPHYAGVSWEYVNTDEVLCDNCGRRVKANRVSGYVARHKHPSQILATRTESTTLGLLSTPRYAAVRAVDRSLIGRDRVLVEQVAQSAYKHLKFLHDHGSLDETRRGSEFRLLVAPPDGGLNMVVNVTVELVGIDEMGHGG